jgi:hypothetical protein
MARKVPVADEAIALVVLDQIALMYDQDEENQTATLTEFLVKTAARVQFQPSTRRLVLTFDLGMSPTEET